MEKRPIMIIAAMEDVELHILKKDINNLKEVNELNCKFYEGDLYGYPVVLCCSDIGCIQASSAVTIGIMKYHPLAIINEGLAGGHGKDIRRNDLVVGTELINIHSIKTSKKKENEGIDISKWDLVTFLKGQDDVLRIQKADQFLIECVKQIEKEYTKGNIVYGRIGSGDVWNSEADRIMYLHKEYHTLCEEMEGIAIYQIANQNQIPVIDIRVISNNDILREEYDRTTGEDLQYFIEKLIKEYIEKKSLL